MKQTAVEWLITQLPMGVKNAIADKIEQAKAMEKEQIIDSWENGFREFYDGSSTPQEYYNKTFKSK